MTAGASIAALPHVLRDRDELMRRFGGRRPAVFLDYDGTLTPIVDRPEDAVMSESMRAAVRGLAQRLGYEYGLDTARKTIDYYDARTSHGSTLSFITHAAVLAALDPESSWERFIAALESDIEDVQGGTTKEGIHLGVMSRTLRSDPARIPRHRHP